jgi:hypothetical protein
MSIYCYKIKYVNFDNINDICGEHNFYYKWHTIYQIRHTFIKKHIYLTMFDTRVPTFNLIYIYIYIFYSKDGLKGNKILYFF